MKFAKSITVAAIMTILAAGTFSTGNTVSADDVTSAKSALSSKKSEATTLLKELQTAQEKVAKIDNKVSDKTLAIIDTKKNISTTEDTIQSYAAKIAKENQEIKSRKAVLKKQLVSLQKKAGNSITGNVYVDFVLNARDLSDLVSRGVTVNKLNSASKDALDAVNEAKAKVKTLKASQESKKADLVATKDKLVADKQELTELQKQAKKDSAALAKKLADNKDEIAVLEKKLTTATAQAAALKAAAEQAKATAAAQAAQADAIAKATSAAATVKKTTTPAAPAASSTSSSTTHHTSNSNSNSNSNSSNGSSSNGSSSSNAGSSISAGSFSSMIAAAKSQQGKPYVWAAANPSVGFDCSGLVMWSAAQVGISLPHQASQQAHYGSEVSLSSLSAGDLLFWGGRNSAYHVAIYIGGGQYIHAPQEGDVVKIATISAGFMPSFARRL
ncbi:NlpC/P60 family protein [Lacticaseibacillus kribbianus]|uniref:C40 family peptidase n=1 Tax=Lacticaseibacillus kribbianus TaxID=2926292 RepID=UPI001CD6E9A9|nr:C40 family peptidase [Lacticaseibacillus kribbianus]